MRSVELLVGTAKGAFFFKSDEARRNWVIEGPMLKGLSVNGLTYDGRTRSRYFAAVSNPFGETEIRFSDDAGSSWHRVEESPAYGLDSGLAMNRVWFVEPGHPSQPETLYAGVDEAGLFVSRDGGQRWQEVVGLNRHPSRGAWHPGFGGLCCHALVIDPRNPRRMWTAISVAGVFRTDDGGETWHVKNQGLPVMTPCSDFEGVASCAHAIGLCTNHPDVLYQQHHNGIFRSDDGAQSWHRIDVGLKMNFGLPLLVSPNDDRTLFISPTIESQHVHLAVDGRLQVFRSHDGGESWDVLDRGLPSQHYYAFALRHGLACDGLDPLGLYLGTTGGDLFFSRDGGAEWQAIPGVGCLPRILCVSAFGNSVN